MSESTGKVDTFLEQLASDLETDALTLDSDLTKLNWDSTAMIGAMALLDEMFGVIVDAKKLGDCKTPRQVLALAGVT